MAEPERYAFSYKEIAEALVKKQRIHEGIWGIYIEFGIQAANAGPSDDELRPVAIIPVLKIGLQRFSKENNLAVDAARVNPKPVGAS
jgi:hypothetical protein